MSAAGQETTFSVLEETPANRYIRTLVVDDSPQARQMVCMLLGREPLVEIVGTAADGVEAVEAAVDLEPQLIVMDVNMPRLDGFKAAAVLAEHHPEIHILLMSADDIPHLSSLGRFSGARGFLSKHDLLRGLPSALRELFPEKFAKPSTAN
jgi:DNA-binding NarL/FixJ family response regulator